MQIPVNKDIDEYKDDFFKGLTMRQTIVCAVTVAVGVCSFLLFSAVLRLPQTISLYLVFPVALPVAAVGLWKIDGLSPLEYLKRKRSVTRTPIYRYKPLVFGAMEQNGGMVEADADKMSGNQKGEKQKEIKKMNKIGMLGPAEEETLMQ
ncbi:MAG: PrgI family protein [Clostridiales bacterium]|nr:PrgI family protein [Clostridiales bacterium]